MLLVIQFRLFSFKVILEQFGFKFMVFFFQCFECWDYYYVNYSKFQIDIFSVYVL